MARHVYFAFDYQDIFKVNQIRMAAEFVDYAKAGFIDDSQWEQLKKQSDKAIKQAINEALKGTTVTVACVGERTANRPWVKYELERSRDEGNGLLGVYLPGESGHAKPKVLADEGAPLYQWDPDRFADWVEQAATRAGR